jgi:flagellar biosynthetic protein FlhB
VKARQRQIRTMRARRRMMAAVPKATVVITNPTHYAVALSYDGENPAPIVVAKGKDLVAAAIRRIAAENDVPIVPDPPLARSLHASVEIGQMIPSELYAAVAQVLAFVYRMASKKKQAQA